MSSNTPNLDLLKMDGVADGNKTFNIETMLNENWDKIDEAVGNMDFDVIDSFTSTDKTLPPSADALRRGLATKLTKSERVVATADPNVNFDIYDRPATQYFTSRRTGALVIVLPKGWATTMLRISIRGHNFTGATNGGGAWNLDLTGYSYPDSQSWLNASAELRGYPPFTSGQISLGFDAALGRGVIVLGSVSTNWDYATIEIENVHAAYKNTGGFDVDWKIETRTDISGITKTVAPKVFAAREDATTRLPLTGGDMTGAIKRTYSNAFKTYENVAGHYLSAVTSTGAVKIKIPRTFSATMLDIEITGYSHRTDGGSWRLLLSAYSNNGGGGNWLYTNAKLIGDAPFSAVTFGFDGTDACILLGGVTTVWPQSTIEVEKVAAIFTNVDGWETGWNISLITDVSGITKALQPTLQKLTTQAYADSVLTSAKADSTVKASQAEANAKMYADAADALKMDAARPSNLLPNGSGVYGFTGWTFGGASTDWYAGKSSGDAPGEFSFRAASGAGARFIQSDPFPVSPGAAYNLSAEFWAESAGNDDFYIEILPATGGGNFGAVIAQSTDRWNRRNTNVTVPTGVNSAIIRLVVAANKAASYKGFRRVQVTLGKGIKAWNDDSDGMALFTSVAKGKGDVKDAVIEKMGTVSQAGSTPTFAELVAGVNSIVLGYKASPGESVLQGPIFTGVYNSPTYSKAWQTRTNIPGVLRLRYTVVNTGSGLGYARVYKNGAPYGVERVVNPGNPTTISYVEDLDFAVGDTIEFWVRAQTTNSNNVRLDNVQVLGNTPLFSAT